MRLPEVIAPHVVDLWLEIGPVTGEHPVTWGEIAAWERHFAPLEPWEARAVRQMSRAYLAAQHEARDPGCPAPWSDETMAEQVSRVEQQFAAMVSALVGQPD